MHTYIYIYSYKNLIPPVNVVQEKERKRIKPRQVWEWLAEGNGFNFMECAIKVTKSTSKRVEAGRVLRVFFGWLQKILRGVLSLPGEGQLRMPTAMRAALVEEVDIVVKYGHENVTQRYVLQDRNYRRKRRMEKAVRTVSSLLYMKGKTRKAASRDLRREKRNRKRKKRHYKKKKI